MGKPLQPWSTLELGRAMNIHQSTASDWLKMGMPNSTIEEAEAWAITNRRQRFRWQKHLRNLAAAKRKVHASKSSK